MRYCIFTLCSKNYKPAYELVIDSWLKTDVNRIFIYTDDPDWKSDNERIEIVHFFKDQSADWLVNVGRRAYATKDVLDNTDFDKVIFLDIDCYIVKDISHVFDTKFDMAVVRFVDGIEISAGVFFINKSDKTKKFGDEWIKIQDKCKERSIGVKPHRCSYSQHGFDKFIKSRYKNKRYDIRKLSFDEYSLKVKDEDAYRESLSRSLSKEDVEKKIDILRQKLESRIRDKNVKVLHFYGNSFRNDKTKKHVFDLVEKHSR